MEGHRKPAAGAGRRPAARPRARRRPHRRAPALLLALPLCGVGPLGCGPSSAPPDADWPAGALLTARREAVAQWVEQLEALEPTPLGRQARELGRRLAALPDCPELEARAPAATGLVAALRCAGSGTAPPSDAPLEGIRGYRGDADLALALPVDAPGAPDARHGDPAAPRALLVARLRREQTHVRIRWPRQAAGGALAELLPGAEPAGPALLAPRERLLHARVRSDALDLAALVPPDSQADDLFRLRSRLLSSLLLDGSWELALYPPADGEAMPRIAAALGVRTAAAARSAAERFLDDVESAWPLRRRPAVFHGQRGACLPDLNLLPRLAPCLVTTEAALVLGWNAESLDHALAGPSAADAAARPALAGDAQGAGAAGRLEVDFTGLGRADRGLAALRGDADPAPEVRWPWRRLQAQARRHGDAIALEIELEAREPRSPREPARGVRDS